MKDATYGLMALALFLIASSMDLADAEREEAALADQLNYIAHAKGANQ